MPIPLLNVTPDEVARLLDLEENHFCDLKAIEIKPAKLSQSFAAFCNSDGGELYIGIAEDPAQAKRYWRGFENQEAANGHLQVLESLFPLSQEHSFEFLRCDGQSGRVLHVTLQRTAGIKKSTDGTVYVRRGAQNLKVVDQEGIRRLERAKGITSFETETINLDIATVANSLVIIDFMLQVVPAGEPIAWLRKQLLVVDGKPTVAAVLLFSDEPQIALPKRSAVKIYRYTTTEASGSRETLAFDPITIEGCIYKQIHDAVARVIQIIEEVRVLGPGGLEPITYPQETLHEIITNAVLHRDYSLADDVHIKVFDNRVEVESPGRLPAHVTVSNILEERYSRNGTIVRLINKFPNPPNKDIGEGLNTAFQAMKMLKLKAPQIYELNNSVRVDIVHQRLATPEEQVMEYLQTHAEITNRVVRDLTGIGSENTVKNVFNRLIDRKQIERVPEKHGSASAYRLPGPTVEPPVADATFEFEDPLENI